MGRKHIAKSNRKENNGAFKGTKIFSYTSDERKITQENNPKYIRVRGRET